MIEPWVAEERDKACGTFRAQGGPSGVCSGDDQDPALRDDILSKAMVAGSPEESMNAIRALVKQRGCEHFILPVMSMDPNYAFALLDQAAPIRICSVETGGRPRCLRA